MKAQKCRVFYIKFVKLYSCIVYFSDVSYTLRSKEKSQGTHQYKIIHRSYCENLQLSSHCINLFLLPRTSHNNYL